MQSFFDDRDQHVNGDGSPDLGFDGIFAVPVESFDAKMLLDPAEEGLDLPSASVQLGDSQSRQMGVVGQEHESLCGVGVFEPDVPQLVRITSGTVDAGEHHGLVTDQPAVAINRMRVESSHPGVGFGAQYEVAAQAMEAMKPLEVKIGAVHHVDGAEFGHELVEDVDVMGFGFGNVDEGGDVSLQVQQGMDFNASLGGAKRRPPEQRQAKVDGSRVKCVDGFGELQLEILCVIQWAGDADQPLGEVGVHLPVAKLVGLGQGTERHAAGDAEMVEFFAVRLQTDDGVAQACALRQLSDCHHPELLGATESAHSVVAVVTPHATLKRVPGQLVHDLGENETSFVHDLHTPC